MTFKELARKRRSIRSFTTQSIDEQQRKELMAPVLMSPTSKNSRPWDFILIDDKDTLLQLSESKPSGAQLIANAPLAIVVAVNKEVSEAWVEDGSIASTILLLQAEEMGLGACWVQISERKRDDGTLSEDFVRGLLNIPENYGVLCVVAVGYKAVERKEQNEDKLLWERVHTNKL